MTAHTTADVAFFRPADGKGKYHAAWKVSHVPACGSPATLTDEAIHATLDTHDGAFVGTVHPLVCARCATKARKALGRGFDT
jgi:hypothetical protein